MVTMASISATQPTISGISPAETSARANTHTPTSGEELISKRAVGGSEIKGATLKLTAENDVTSDGQSFQPITWISDGTPEKLKLRNGTYTLTET